MLATAGNCAHDRIVTTSSATASTVTDSAHVLQFDQAFAIDADTTRGVSDHYPVTVSVQLQQAFTSGPVSVTLDAS